MVQVSKLRKDTLRFSGRTMGLSLPNSVNINHSLAMTKAMLHHIPCQVVPYNSRVFTVACRCETISKINAMIVIDINER